MHASSSTDMPNTTIKAIHEDRLPLVQWTHDSWREKTTAQPIGYACEAEVDEICSILRRFKPLVSIAEIDYARSLFSDVACGNGFIIQGGDCAESFADVSFDYTAGHVGLLSRQAQILSEAMGGIKIIRVGRIAGQYAKPRSKPHEILPSGEVVHSFRGHNINSEDPKDRIPDPRRLLLGHLYSTMTMNSILKLHGCRNGFDASHASEKAGIENSEMFFTSHEAFCLPLESALTHGQYNTSATFLWVGERTRHLDSAHIEYIRGLRNPIGVKVGPTTKPTDLVDLLNLLSPCPKDISSRNRITLITRLGSKNVDTVLPPLIEAVQRSGHWPVWLCDPCHGNTESVFNGKKIRRVEIVCRELEETWTIHKRLHNYMGGIHLEQTWECVTECIDGGRVATEDDVKCAYRTLCDPRLAGDQAIDVLKRFAEFIRQCKV